jgi:hypothetical protein
MLLNRENERPRYAQPFIIDGWWQLQQPRPGGAGGRDPQLGTLTLLGAISMARWPRHVWTTIFTYGTVFVLFPLLCWLAYAWVRGQVF